MSMAAGAAVLRSLATKLGRAPPRLPTSSGVLPGRFYTSTGGSMPNLRGPQPHNKKDPSWLRAMVAFNKAAPIAAFFLIAGPIYVHCTLSPALDRMEAHTEAQIQALVTMREEIKKTGEMTRVMLPSNKGSQTVASSEGQGMEHV